MTRVINLYGGPGTGKSTAAAALFSLLKTKGVNAELVREYVKDWSWIDRTPQRFDQVHFLGEQFQRESILHGKVHTIVTDSPLYINAFFSNMFAPDLGLVSFINNLYKVQEAEGIKHVHVFLKRTKAYNPAGRWQTEAQASAMDGNMQRFLTELGVDFSTLTHEELLESFK